MSKLLNPNRMLRSSVPRDCFQLECGSVCLVLLLILSLRNLRKGFRRIKNPSSLRKNFYRKFKRLHWL